MLGVAPAPRSPTGREVWACSPALVTQVIAVRVTVTEQLRRKTHPEMTMLCLIILNSLLPTRLHRPSLRWHTGAPGCCTEAGKHLGQGKSSKTTYLRDGFLSKYIAVVNFFLSRCSYGQEMTVFLTVLSQICLLISNLSPVEHLKGKTSPSEGK